MHTPGIDQDAFDQLLARIRNNEHPEYGTLSWDGESREITETVLFEQPGDSEATVRQRAIAYLSQLTPAERAAVKVDVHTRQGRPYRAVVKGKTSSLSPDRLRELKRGAGIT